MIISDLPFKGERNYLQGPDIYEWVAGELRKHFDGLEITKVVMTFHKLAGTQLGLLLDGERNESFPVVGEVSAVVDGAMRRGQLVATDCAVAKRTPYPEEKIVESCSFGDREISFHAKLPFHAAEIAVSMTKALHKKVFPAEMRKWLFVRIELRRLLTEIDAAAMKVVLQQYIETRFSKSALWCGGEEVGVIYFSVQTA